MNKSLVIVGAGGHGQAVADSANLSGEWSHIAFVDDSYPERKKALGKDIVGKVDHIFEPDVNFDCYVVAIGNNAVRMEIIQRIESERLNLVSIVHPRAWLSEHAQVESGVMVMAGAVVGTNAILGKGCLINVNATVDHDCVLESGAHLGVGVQLAGGVNIGKNVWLQVGVCAAYGVVVAHDEVITCGTKLVSK